MQLTVHYFESPLLVSVFKQWEVQYAGIGMLLHQLTRYGRILLYGVLEPFLVHAGIGE